MKKRIILAYIIALLMVMATFTSCLPEGYEEALTTKAEVTVDETPSDSAQADESTQKEDSEKEEESAESSPDSDESVETEDSETAEDADDTVLSEDTEESEEVDFSEWQEYAEENLPEYISIEDFSTSTEYGSPKVSYDGTKIYYRHITDYTDYIEVMDIETGDIDYVQWPSGVAGIPYFYTTPDNNKVILLIDDYGDENFGLYLADIQAQTTKEILPAGDSDCVFLGFNQSNDDECYIGVFDFDESVYNYHIYSFNIVTEEMTLMLTSTPYIVSWDFDYEGRLLAVTTIDEEASYHVWLRNDFDSTSTEFNEDEWTNIITWEYEDADSSGVVSFDRNSENLILIDSSVDNLNSVVNYNIATGEKTIISQDSEGTYDPSGVWLDAETREVTGVAYLRERLEWEALDDSYGQHLEVLYEISDGELDIVSSSRLDEVWVVSFSYDTQSTEYYLYDAETMEAEYLFTASPEMNEYEYASMEAIEFESSDGLTIHGYVTFPLNLEQEDLPLVIYVHGGPWSRDVWGYDETVQFLANRGYMVLQVNFRGSTGYGKDFMLAGDMEWGAAMHQDILDALDWVVEQGWADPDRVCIMGASYGGYEALVGAAFTPEYFACAIDMFGPSSLITLVESQPEQWSSYSQNLYRSIGNPEEDEELMMERSPLYSAENISIPLLIFQGGNDVRVTQEQSDQLVEAMEDAGIDVEYILFPTAGHGFSTSAQLQTFYETAESFLAEYIGGISNVD